ncbi:outer membrane protein assembly factor BamE [Aestuariibacter salexigens]|uniref:outer membrane protein assembly factor BamE n=1 Tax=Aestuariibacter salexigens TaxID=226010 RepID=UPI00040CAB71|nr:outer membrane protein assembly factor BamE [Aestuariibacter salexigens]
MKKWLQCGVVLAFVFVSSACSSWIYRIDIPQGNFLDQKDVDQLRIGMSKEQVVYVLGHPVIEDSFNQDTWYYIYDMKRGMRVRGEDVRKELFIKFDRDKLAAVEGDFELHEDFNIPLDQ